jgi:hypothetical protein
VPEQRLGCGCAIRLEGVACGRDYAQAHLFSEFDGAPLWLSIDGRETALPSEIAPTHAFSHARGERWIDRYRRPGLEVRIEYGPGRNTCVKEQPADEDCEYFDVETEVFLRSDSRTTRYHGVGTCGC